MAITHVASAAGATSNPTLTDQATLSALIQAGDFLEVWVHNRYADQSVNLQGVTDNDSGGNTWAMKGASANGRLSLWWKIATSGTAGKVVTATLDASGAIIMGYTAHRSDGPGFDENSITNLVFEANASGNEVMAGFTPAAPNSFIGLAVAPMNDVAISSQSTTSPGALTERWDKVSSAAQDHGLAFAEALQSGGPTATGNFTWSQTNVAGDSGARALAEVQSVPPNEGTVSGSVGWVGSVTGATDHGGAASGAVGWAGFSTGSVVHSAAASGALDWTGSATGTSVHAGSAAGSVGWSGTADGVAPLTVQQGAANGTISWAGTAIGATTRAGDVTGGLSWAGIVTGVTVHQGTATGAVGWVGATTGVTTSEGASTGAVTWAGSATGQAPTVGVEEGSAEGAISWTGTATGTAGYQGSAAGTVVWTGTVDGISSHQGVAVGTVQWVGEATSIISPPPRVRLEASGLGYGSEASHSGTGLEGSSI